MVTGWPAVPMSVPAPLRIHTEGARRRSPASAAKRSACTSAGVVCSKVAASPGCGVSTSQARREDNASGCMASACSASASTTADGREGHINRACTNAAVSGSRPMPGPSTIPPHWRRNGKSSSSSAGLHRTFPAGPRARVMMSGQSALMSRHKPCGAATLISPPPARKAARAARCGAPVSPSEPPTIKMAPAVPLCHPGAASGKAPAMAFVII